MTTASAQPNDWFSSPQKYWDSWFEQQRKFVNVAPAAPQGPQALWGELLKNWQGAVFGGAHTAPDTDAFRHSFTKAGETYLNMMQQFYQGTGQAKPIDQMTKEWAENLQKLFTGGVHTGTDPLSAIDPLNFFAGFPGIGYTREKQEQLNHLYQQWSDYEAKSREYTAGMTKVGLEAVQKFQDYVTNPPQGAAPLTSLKEVYAKWVDICEDIYARYAMSEEYTRIYGEVVNALMAFKKKQNEISDEIIGQLNMPTRAEVDSLHKQVHALKRELHALKAAAKPVKQASAPAAIKKGKKMTVAVQLDPEKIFKEVTNFNTKLAEGVKNLRKVGDLPSGVTEKEAVYSEDKLTLYRYRNPSGKKATNGVPLLISYALVNRPYMTDLQENRSMIRGLLETGQDVYLIDWGYPDRSDRFLTLDDYINGYIDRCVDVLREIHGVDKVNLLGICQGGAFSLCYAALHPDKIENLVTMVTPVDFQTDDNMLAHWIRNIDVDLLVDSLGNVPGDLMNWTFLNMKPYRLIGQKYIDMVEILDNPQQIHNFMYMEKWIFDSPDQAGEAYRQFVNDFYKYNKLIKGEVELGGETVDLKNIACPVLNVYAQDDHLVPPSASKPLKGCVGTKDYTELSFRGGHIGIYVSSSAQREVPPSIGKWLNEQSLES